LVGFTLAMRNDYHRGNFGVSVICPGMVKTPMVDPGGPSKIYSKMPRIPGWLFTTPERVAQATVDAIKRDRGLVIVTFAAHLMWYLNRFFPGIVDLLNREGWRSRGAIIPQDEMQNLP
jgi:3-oxoacyl-[acyl-carrier protein] reductase